MSPQQPWTPPQPPYTWQAPPPLPATPPRKRRRIFPWVFLAVQVLFVLLVILQASGGTDIHAQAVAYCHAHPDPYLPFSQCVSDYGTGSKAGTAIGAGLLVVLWAVADVILGISYGVWRLARR